MEGQYLEGSIWRAVFGGLTVTPTARESSYSSALFVMGGLSSSRDAISKVERFSLGKMVWENICEVMT